MAKTKISEFSATPGNNTDIDGINIAEGCAPSGINNAIRELMSQLKDFQAGTAGDSFNGPVGTSTAAAGAFTTLSASSTVSGTGFSNYLASPPAIGGTTAAAGSFTTLTTSGAVTHNAGTANGVAYLNGSKVLTTGSALTFDGSQFDIPAGTAAAPSLSTPADVNTGLYFPAADTIGLSTNGTERVRLDSSGNLGIGTSSPTYKVEAIGSSPAFFGESSTNGTQVGYRATMPSNSTNCFVGWVSDAVAGLNGDLALCPRTSAGGRILFFTGSTTPSERMRLDSSGNVGIGTSSPFADTGYRSIDIRGSSTGAQINLGTTATRVGQITCDTTNGITFNTATPTPLRFFTDGNERARIDSSGNLLVGTTSAIDSARLSVRTAGGTVISSQVAANSNYVLAAVNASGSVVGGVIANASSTSFPTSSDYRLKENIAPMTGALAKVQQLKPVTYTWKATGEADEGFIAHELAEVCPSAVVGEKDAVDADGNPKYQGIDTSFLVATLTAALQESHGLIKDLQARVDALEAK